MWRNMKALRFEKTGSLNELKIQEVPRPVPAEAVQPKPRALTFEQAASVGIPYLTAWHAIIDVASLKEGETVLITGTAGAVGDAAARIAKRVCRAIVIGTTRRHTGCCSP